MKDNAVVVASYLLIGLTEVDVHYIRKQLENYACIFLNERSNLDAYSIEIIQDVNYPCIALKIKAEIWEDFAQSHDMVELSAVMAQNNILGGLH